MDKLVTRQTRETESLRKAYAALNSGDIAGFVENFDPDIVRTEHFDFSSTGTYRGIAAVTENATEGRSSWAEGGCEPERFVVEGDKAIVFVHVRVRLKGRTEWIDDRIVDGFRFRDGKVIEFRSFLKEHEAMEWAGIEAPETN